MIFFAPIIALALASPQSSAMVQIKVQDQGLPPGYRVEMTLSVHVLGWSEIRESPEYAKERLLGESASSHEIVLRSGQKEGTIFDIPLKAVPECPYGFRIFIGLPATYTIYDAGNRAISTRTVRFNAQTTFLDHRLIVLYAKQSGFTSDGQPNILVEATVGGQSIRGIVGTRNLTAPGEINK